MSVSFISSAVDYVYDSESEYKSAISGKLDPDGVYIYNGQNSEEEPTTQKYSFFQSFSPSLQATTSTTKTSPNFTWFNPADMPYSEMPSYIQNILFNMQPNYNVQSTKVPFAMFIVTSSQVYFLVGINCAFGYTSKNSSPYQQGVLLNTNRFSVSNNSVLYVARYDNHYKLAVNFAPASFHENYSFSSDSNTYNSSFYNVRSYTSTTNLDIYLYGNNFLKAQEGSDFTMTYQISSTYNFTYSSSPSGGFDSLISSGRGFSSQFLSVCYLKSFSPVTPEQEAENTRKGILETIKGIPTKIGEFFTNLVNVVKELPSKIADLIKGLFVPDEEQLNELLDEFSEICSEHLGIVYQVGEFVSDIFNQLVSYNPKSDGFTLTFPSISAAYVDSGGEVQTEELSDEQQFSLSEIISQSPWNTLYTAYRTVVWVAFLVMLIRLAERKFNSIVGGGSN